MPTFCVLPSCFTFPFFSLEGRLVIKHVILLALLNITHDFSHTQKQRNPVGKYAGSDAPGGVPAVGADLGIFGVGAKRGEADGHAAGAAGGAGECEVGIAAGSGPAARDSGGGSAGDVSRGVVRRGSAGVVRGGDQFTAGQRYRVGSERAFRDAANPSARACLEAVVQRVPAYVDDADELWERDADLSAVNARFGRSLRVVSVSWRKGGAMEASWSRGT